MGLVLHAMAGAGVLAAQAGPVPEAGRRPPFSGAATPVAPATASAVPLPPRDSQGRYLLRLPQRGVTAEAPLQASRVHRGGGHCHRDLDCGWHDPGSTAVQDRRTLPSGNGARCLVDRCECADDTDSKKIGCPRCTVTLHPRYSYSDAGVEYSTQVKDELGRHFDLCDVPVGGQPCMVGICARDLYNRTISCPGDFECDAAGGGNGICVGEDEGMGYCVCSQDFFCRDCSLHQRDLLQGAACGRSVSGGALCLSHGDCSGGAEAGFCASPRHVLPEPEYANNLDMVADEMAHVLTEERPFCHCEPGRTCRRCEQLQAEVSGGTATCHCDAPRLAPRGGAHTLRGPEATALSMPVVLTAEPWDSDDECEVLYAVYHNEDNWTQLPWPSDQEAVAFLRENGTRTQRREDGSEIPVVLEYTGWLKEDGNMTKDFVYIYAVSVPRPNTTWKMTASPLVRSELFILSLAVHQSGVGISVILALLSSLLQSPW